MSSRYQSRILLALLLLAGLPRPPSAAEAQPLRPERIAVTLYFLLGDLLAIGYPPACAIAFAGFPGPGTDPVEYELSLQHKILSLPAPPDEVSEQLVACRPDLIVDGRFKQDSVTGRRLARLAPVLWINTDWERRPTDPSKLWTRWKEILWQVAVGLGGPAPARAASVLADMERRAAALRGHVGGRLFASIAITTPATWVMYGPYVNGNGTMPMSVDLGMKSVIVPDSIGYSNSPRQGCFKGGFDQEGRPIICSAVNLSPELFGILEPAEIILNAYGSQRAEVLKENIDNPLFQPLPAVRTGRFVQGGQWSWSVYGAATVYAVVARAFQVEEYFATPQGWGGMRASLAFDRVKGSVCWAVTVRPGHDAPSGPIVLSARELGTEHRLTLAATPEYTDIDAGVAPEDIPPWRHELPMRWSTGCVPVPPASQNTWFASPQALQLDLGHGAALLEHGAPPIGPAAW